MMSKENGFFDPEHINGLELIKRADGQFDTPIEISYHDPAGKIWTAPQGTITDGASIPDLVAVFFGGKLSGDYLFAVGFRLRDATLVSLNKRFAPGQ